MQILQQSRCNRCNIYDSIDRVRFVCECGLWSVILVREEKHYIGHSSFMLSCWLLKSLFYYTFHLFIALNRRIRLAQGDSELPSTRLLSTEWLWVSKGSNSISKKAHNWFTSEVIFRLLNFVRRAKVYPKYISWISPGCIYSFWSSFFCS